MGKRGGRPVKYGEAFSKVLGKIWDEFGKPCGKLLVPMIKGMIDFLVKSVEPCYGITEEIKKLLLEVSAAQADIVLKPMRNALEIKGLSTTRSVQTPLRSQIPVRTHFNRGTVKPGMFAFDTVAHCGGSARGQYCTEINFRNLVFLKYLKLSFLGAKIMKFLILEYFYSRNYIKFYSFMSRMTHHTPL